MSNFLISNNFIECWQDNPEDRLDIQQNASEHLTGTEEINSNRLIEKFIRAGDEIITLYEKAKHNKELCDNAMAANLLIVWKRVENSFHVEDELSNMRNEIRQIKEFYLLFMEYLMINNFVNRIDVLTQKHMKFQSQKKTNYGFIRNEPLFDGKQYPKPVNAHTKKIKKYIIISRDECCFKEFSNNNNYHFSNQSQFEIRR
ncbi:hypothetical protein C1645_835246 [Glomus cerebriforme]|uniref:Uncharacterized protein n=1 Tax=Glomus cerebriforme TaxID=658196 RepID=A0A397S858_9GLOM|nr:hypothetical protein C1645_835246 [Glomus cerebriforme]